MIIDKKLNDGTIKSDVSTVDDNLIIPNTPPFEKDKNLLMNVLGSQYFRNKIYS